ncbi:uncharacterized protein ACDP82_003154 [Pangshura tecta]
MVGFLEILFTCLLPTVLWAIHLEQVPISITKEPRVSRIAEFTCKVSGDLRMMVGEGEIIRDNRVGRLKDCRGFGMEDRPDFQEELSTSPSRRTHQKQWCSKLRTDGGMSGSPLCLFLSCCAVGHSPGAGADLGHKAATSRQLCHIHMQGVWWIGLYPHPLVPSPSWRGPTEAAMPHSLWVRVKARGRLLQ